ncbi:putative oxidoreductase [Colletotrichum shisoi]|uniref:Putative oxidoreductase n=1 Tax=Colletotrichum shisoi TaxID=2078593 RepID=A0A5Q4BCS2_9PEZI|nr:putative oxidoreductase [Colletotrichum shisoi]
MSFSPEKDIPDLSGKVIIVTGGSSGLGKESDRSAGRRRHPGDPRLPAAVPSAEDKIKFLALDLGSFASIQRAAATFLASSDRLDILMNNAGRLASAAGLAPDGYETQFGSNYMGPSLFTKLLLPLFKQAPKGGILLDQVKTPMGDVSGVARDGQSKLADYYHTRILSRLYPTVPTIKFVGIHPGVVNTGIFDDLISRRPWLSGVAGVIASVFLTDVRTGVTTQLWASGEHGKQGDC